MLAELKVGKQTGAAGATVTASADTTGGTRTAPARGKHADAASRGEIYNGSTAVGGVAPGTSLTTSGQHTALYNPPSSGKNLELLVCSLGFVSGTLGAGFMAYAQVITGIAGTTNVMVGTERTTRSTKLNGGAGAGRFYEDCSPTVAPTILRPAFNFGAFVTTTAALPGALKDELDGEFIVPPSTSFIVSGIAASGTSPLVVVGLTWQEVAI